MNRSLPIRCLYTARAGLEFKLTKMKFTQMIDLEVWPVFFIHNIIKYYLELTIFENWIEDPLSNINHELQSAINFAELYWQGLDPRFDLYSHLFFFIGVQKYAVVIRLRFWIKIVLSRSLVDLTNPAFILFTFYDKAYYLEIEIFHVHTLLLLLLKDIERFFQVQCNESY